VASTSRWGRLIAAKLGIDKVDFKEVISKNREDFIKQGSVGFRHRPPTRSPTTASRSSTSPGPYYVTGQQLLVAKDDDSIKGPGGPLRARRSARSPARPRSPRWKRSTAQTRFRSATYTECVNQLTGGSVDAVTTDGAISAGLCPPSSRNKLKVVGDAFQHRELRHRPEKGRQPHSGPGSTTSWTSRSPMAAGKKAFDDTLGKSGVSTPEPPKVDRY